MKKKWTKPGIYIEHGRKLVKSKAFLSLTGKSAQVYLMLLGRRQMQDLNRGRPGKRKKLWECINNGEIIFTHKEAYESYGITNRQFGHAINQLVDRGLIGIIPGYPLKFEFVDNWINFGTNKFEPLKRNKAALLFKRPTTEEEKKEFAMRFKKNKEK